MLKQQEIQSYLASHLGEVLGIPDASARIMAAEPRQNRIASQPDLFLGLAVEGRDFRFVVEIKQAIHLSEVRHAIEQLKALVRQYPGYLPLLIAPFLSRQKRGLCKAEGVFYLDLSGNLYIRVKGLYLERVSDQNRFPRRQIKKNPFADRASLIIRMMLDNPKRAWGIREIAGASGINPGWVSQVVQHLDELHYVVRDPEGVRLVRPKDILDDWVNFYSYKNNQSTAYYCHAKGIPEILKQIAVLRIPKEIRYSLTLHAGAWLVAPHAVVHEVHIYADGDQDQQKILSFWKEHLKLEQAERGANFYLLKPYYHRSAFYGMRLIKGLNVVSDLQLYLDLKHYPLRGEEQAEFLFEKRLKSKLRQGD